MTEMTTQHLRLADEEATLALGRALAAHARAGDVIALEGGLGSGKTVLARAFIRHLAGEAEDVPSPTFTLVQIYHCDSVSIWHFDLYRLNDPEEALELGIEEAFHDAVSLIEWPERLGNWLPARRLTLRLDPGESEEGRIATLVYGPDWAQRLGDLGA